MKSKYIISSALLIFTLGVKGQQFSNAASIDLEGAFYGDVLVSNFSGAQNQDILLTGTTANELAFTGLFSQNDNYTLASNQNFTMLQNSAAAVGDINNDGLMDFAISGRDNNYVEFVEIYYNTTNGTFAKVTPTEIRPTTFGSLALGDLNNDGLLDVLISGIDSNSNYITNLYFQNEEGTFYLSDQNFIGAAFGTNKIFDANNDGFMDVLITGFSSNYVPETKLYLNNAGTSFTDTASGIMNCYFSAVDIFDIDNDNDLDIVISGMVGSNAPSLKLYKNNGNGIFVESTQPEFIGTYTGGTKFIDFNNDGHIDIISSGNNGTDYKTYLYQGTNGGTFTNASSLVQNVDGISMGKIAVLDYDNDNDSDFVIMGINNNGEEIAKIFSNNQFLNTKSFSNETILFYPNPCKEVLNINATALFDTVEIYDVSGRNIKVNVFQNTLDVSFLNPGTYIIKSVVDEQTRYTKIIKE